MLNRWRTGFWVLLVVAGAALAGTKSSSLMQRLSSPTGHTKLQATSTSKLSAKPIDQVHLGDRVPGNNPVEAPDERYGKEVDRATWRRVDLSCAKRDGSDADVSLLRPAWWLEQQGAKVGGHLRIAVPECGIDGEASVVALGPCPPIRPGLGNVVTGMFRHRNATVIDLFIEGLSEPIGTTPNHRIWSEDRKAFIRADQLRTDELLRSPNINARVIATRVRSALSDVYNIETYPFHTYSVSLESVLVHNAAPDVPAPGNIFLYHGTNKGPIDGDAFKLGVTPRAGTPVGESGVYFTPDLKTAISQYATGKNGIVYRIEVPKETAEKFLLSETLNGGATQYKITDSTVLVDHHL